MAVILPSYAKICALVPESEGSAFYQYVIDIINDRPESPGWDEEYIKELWEEWTDLHTEG